VPGWGRLLRKLMNNCETDISIRVKKTISLDLQKERGFSLVLVLVVVLVLEPLSYA
jgi:hypothetical protein